MSLWALLLWLLGQGVVVSQVVDLLKRMPFVAEHPKLVAAILNLLAILAASYLNIAGLGDALSGFLLAIIAGLASAAASVATYEVRKTIVAR